MPDNKELQDRIDLMLTMHSKKRDELRRRSWILEAATITSSVFLCSMTFYDFGDSPWDNVFQTFMRVFSIIMVACSIIWLHSTCRTDAEKHQEATRGYAELKKELEGLQMSEGDHINELTDINMRVKKVSDVIQISERDFIRLKQYHKRKEFYREHIKEHLSVPYCVARYHMWRLLRRIEKSRGSK